MPGKKECLSVLPVHFVTKGSVIIVAVFRASLKLVIFPERQKSGYHPTVQYSHNKTELSRSKECAQAHSAIRESVTDEVKDFVVLERELQKRVDIIHLDP